MRARHAGVIGLGLTAAAIDAFAPLGKFIAAEMVPALGALSSASSAAAANSSSNGNGNGNGASSNGSSSNGNGASAVQQGGERATGA